MANQVLAGFYNRRDLLDQRVTDSNIPEFNRAIDESLAEHRRQFDALFGLFASRTTEYKVRHKTAISTRNQPLDENGRSLPIKRAGYYEVALPIYMSGNAWGANWITRQKMTGQEVSDQVAALIQGDILWNRDHILATLFLDDGYTFSDPEHGDLTVEGAANGDSIVYQIMNGAASAATDDHIIAQASAIDNSNNPYNDIYEDLIEHPENEGPIISFIPTSLKATTIALTNFIDEDDPDIRQGDDTARLTGRLGVNVPGTVLGKTDKVWIVEWPVLPDDYIISVAAGGERPLAMREDPDVQGFVRVADRNDHPFYESQYARIAGYGGWNRVGWRVDRIGNGTYAVPTNYQNVRS